MGNILYDYTKEFLIKNINLTLSDSLQKIEIEALNRNVPIIEKETQNLISMILKIQRPKTILESGTAIGFSTLFMYEQLNKDVFITTIERDKERAEIARRNFKIFKCEEHIKMIEGDCFENTEYLENNYDFIFVDSSKSHYEKLFDICITKLNKDGIMIFDNILYKGMIVLDNLVNKRKKTIVKKMRKFIHNVVNNKKFSTLILPIGDGIMILRRD